MYASMTKVNRGISIDPVLTRRSMVLNGLHGSNYLRLCRTCESNDLLRLNSTRVDQVYPMRRMIKDLVDMHTSIHALSSMIGDCDRVHPSSY